MKEYLYLAIAVVWAASLGVVGWWQNDAGHVAERDAWMKRENKELRDANAEIERLTEQARKAEASHAQNITDISTAYQKELSHAQKQRDRDVAAAYSGALVLRYDATGFETNRCAAGTPGAGPGGRDGAQAGQLPGTIAADLFILVDDADNVARQLAAAQKVIIEDRRLCGGSPP